MATRLWRPRTVEKAMSFMVNKNAPVSHRLQPAGVGLFWVLAIGIVLARAVYFEPSAFSFEPVVAYAQSLLATH